MLLPCTYDVALVHGHLTVLLSGKLAQSTTVKEWKYVQYILRELSTFGVCHRFEGSEPSSKVAAHEREQGSL